MIRCSFSEFWIGCRERPPDVDKLGRFLVTPRLAPVWQRYLTERLTFLREHPSVNAPIGTAFDDKRVAHAGQALDFVDIGAGHLAAEHGALLEDGVQHAGQREVDAVRSACR